jgi:hypothetical protein
MTIAFVTQRTLEFSAALARNWASFAPKIPDRDLVLVFPEESGDAMQGTHR